MPVLGKLSNNELHRRCGNCGHEWADPGGKRTCPGCKVEDVDPLPITRIKAISYIFEGKEIGRQNTLDRFAVYHAPAIIIIDGKWYKAQLRTRNGDVLQCTLTALPDNHIVKS